MGLARRGCLGDGAVVDSEMPTRSYPSNSDTYPSNSDTYPSNSDTYPSDSDRSDSERGDCLGGRCLGDGAVAAGGGRVELTGCAVPHNACP